MLKNTESNKTKILNIICIMLVLLSAATRVVLFGTRITHNVIIYMLYTAALAIWILQIRRRLLRPEVRRNLIMAACMMIFWMGVRTVKYEFLPQSSVMNRYAWYLYYVPQTFCVLLMFFSALYIGRPYDRPISRAWKLLYIPAALLSIGILTNDLHQLAFRFLKDENNRGAISYTHGPLYFASVLWVILLFAAILAIVLIRCAVPGRRKKAWIPMLPLGIGVYYLIMFFVNPHSYLFFLFKTPEIICVVFAAFVEGLIVTHLLPSNDGYEDFWRASSIGAGIMDLGGVVRYESKQNAEVSPEQIREAKDHEILLREGNLSLRSHKISGGYGYWLRDVSDINRLNRKLEELGDVLAEENAILDAENKLAESRVQIEQQSRLYDRLAKSVKSEIDSLNHILDNLPQEEEPFEQIMKYACILNAYIKRHSNLLLLEHQSRDMAGEELRLAITESLEYVRLYGIKTYGSYRVKGTFSGECILTAYELVEAVLEAGIPGADAILVNLDMSEDKLSLRMELNRPGERLKDPVIINKIHQLHGMLEIEMEQQTEYVSLVFGAGGVCV